jgi:hypothetical protein
MYFFLFYHLPTNGIQLKHLIRYGLCSFLIRLTLHDPFNMKKNLLFLILFCTTSLMSVAQIKSWERVELNYEKDFYIDQVFTCGENGLIVSTSGNIKRAERDPDRLYVFYDTNLIEISSLKVEVPFRQKISSTYSDKLALFTFHYDSRFGDFSVVRIDPTLDKEQVFAGKLPKGIIERGFAVYNGYAVLCNLTKRKSELIVINLSTSSYHVISLPQQLSRNEIALVDFRPFENGLEFGVIVREKNRKDLITYLIVLDQNGQQSQVLEIGNIDERIISATSNRLEDGSLVVSGTYSNYSNRTADGMFISVFDSTNLRFFRTLPFGSFNNFFEYMTERGQDYMNRQKERHERHEKDYNINVLMLVHPVEKLDSEFILMGEVYFPTYRELRTTTYTYGRPVSTSSRVFDGYQYSHAAMVRFNEKGDFINDYCFPISLWKKPRELEQIVQMNTTDTSIHLAYINSNSLKSKTISPNNQTEYTSNLQAGENDQIRYSLSNIDYWYGNYFLSNGYQNLKNTKDKHQLRKRDVFYLQKVEIR